MSFQIRTVLLLACVPGVLAPASRAQAQHALPPARIAATTDDGGATWTVSHDSARALVIEVEVDAAWATIDGPARFVLQPGTKRKVRLLGDEWAADLGVQGAASTPVRFLPVDTADDFGRPLGKFLAASGANPAAGGGAATISGAGGTFSLASSANPSLPFHDGFTVFTPSADTRIVYVSSSLGDDANDGLSELTPKRTIAAGKSLVRNGFPDWLLLRRGDVFVDSFNQWKTVGRSPLEPQLIGAWGPGNVRPRLDTGSGIGLVTHGGGGSPAFIDHVALVGIHFRAHTYDGNGQPAAVSLHRPTHGFLIEDCKIENYCTGIVLVAIDGRHENVRVRRTIVVDSFNADGQGNPQGLYAAKCDRLLVEECTLDHNGWREGTPGAEADIFSHNVYLDTDNSGVILRGNLIARGASHGAQVRSGGMARSNLFVRNTIALMMGGAAGPLAERSDAIGNVFLDARDLDDLNPRGWGIDFNNVLQGSVRLNIFANNVDGSFPLPILLDGNGFGGGVHNVLVERNIVWDWGGVIYLTGDQNRLTDIVFRYNDLQDAVDVDGLLDHQSPGSFVTVASSNNRFYDASSPAPQWMQAGPVNQSVAQWKSAIGDSTSKKERAAYLDPYRDVARYSQYRGGAPTLDAFLAPFRDRPAQHWERDWSARGVIAWIRDGYVEP